MLAPGNVAGCAPSIGSPGLRSGIGGVERSSGSKRSAGRNDARTSRPTRSRGSAARPRVHSRGATTGPLTNGRTAAYQEDYTYLGRHEDAWFEQAYEMERTMMNLLDEIDRLEGKR